MNKLILNKTLCVIIILILIIIINKNILTLPI